MRFTSAVNGWLNITNNIPTSRCWMRLDFAAIKYQAESPAEDENSAQWYTSQSQCGFTVPLMCGYQRISPVYAPGEVENARATP